LRDLLIHRTSFHPNQITHEHSGFRQQQEDARKRGKQPAEGSRRDTTYPLPAPAFLLLSDRSLECFDHRQPILSYTSSISHQPWLLAPPGMRSKVKPITAEKAPAASPSVLPRAELAVPPPAPSRKQSWVKNLGLCRCSRQRGKHQQIFVIFVLSCYWQSQLTGSSQGWGKGKQVHLAAACGSHSPDPGYGNKYKTFTNCSSPRTARGQSEIKVYFRKVTGISCSWWVFRGWGLGKREFTGAQSQADEGLSYSLVCWAKETCIFRWKQIIFKWKTTL